MNWTRTALTLVLCAACFTWQATAAGQAEPPAPDDSIGTKPAALPLVSASCAFLPASGAFKATQTEGDKAALLDVRFDNCRFTQTPDGLSTLTVDTRWEFSPSSKLGYCSSMASGFLFEVTVTTPGFAWAGTREVINDLSLQNLSGNSQNGSFFRFHSQLDTSTLTIADVLPAHPDVPNFDHIYWGKLVLLKEAATSDFSRELARHTPVNGAGNGKPDYAFEFRVNVPSPRGWCWYQHDENGTPVTRKADLAFSILP